MVKIDLTQQRPQKTVICGKTFLMLVCNQPLAEETTHDGLCKNLNYNNVKSIKGKSLQNKNIYGSKIQHDLYQKVKPSIDTILTCLWPWARKFVEILIFHSF